MEVSSDRGGNGRLHIWPAHVVLQSELEFGIDGSAGNAGNSDRVSDGGKSDAAALVRSLMAQGFSRKDAVKQAAAKLELPKNVVYDASLEDE